MTLVAVATPWLAVPLAVCTAVSTAVGGLVALHYRRELGTVIAFSGGVVVAVALFDVLPEAVDNPTIGAAVALSTQAVGGILALSVGFFLFLGASNLLPEAYRDHPSRLRVALTVAGFVFIFAVVWLATGLA